MDENSVIFKATVNNFILVMREEDDFDLVLAQIERKLEAAGKFFKGASMNIRYRGKKLTPEQENVIFDLMKTGTGAEIKSIEEDTGEGPREQEEDPIPKTKPVMRKLHFKGIQEGVTRFYRGTVRSGQLVRYDGNLVVIGDVNPGGVVEATGNVVVMGSLRGVVHAGADGNKEALVVAFNLQPMQLRIADVITRCPDEKEQRSNMIPEMAFVKEDMVYIERFLPQYK